MKKSNKLRIIFYVLLLELGWVLWPRFYTHGYVLDEAFRNVERRATLFAWLEHRTPETKAAYDAEVRLLDKHVATRDIAILATGLVVNVAGIYLFWKYLPTKIAPNTVPDPMTK